MKGNESAMPDERKSIFSTRTVNKESKTATREAVVTIERELFLFYLSFYVYEAYRSLLLFVMPI